MTIDNTTTALVASIKRRGFIPAGSGLTDLNILSYATDELESYIPALLKSIREEFIIASLDISVTDGTVDVPERACGAAFRTIAWVESGGRERQLPRIEPENAGGFAGQAGDAVGYMFRGNTIVLLPAPTSGTLRVTYQQRPGVLVPTTDCALVTAFPSTFRASVESVPDAFADLPLVDLVSSTPNFTAIQLDEELDAVGANYVDFTTNPQTLGLSVGDYICVAGETCIPQVPTEVHGLLAQAAAYAIANAIGSERAPIIEKKLAKLEADVKQVLTPRSDGSARPIVSRSRIGRWANWW